MDRIFEEVQNLLIDAPDRVFVELLELPRFQQAMEQVKQAKLEDARKVSRSRDVYFSIREKDTETFFKAKELQTLSLAIKTWCERNGKNRDDYTFTYEDDLSTVVGITDQTPKSLDLPDKQVITATYIE